MDPAITQAVLVQVGAHLAMGKETGITAGVAAGLPPLASGVVAFVQDSLVFLVGFPLVVFAEHRIRNVPRVARFLDRVRAKAAERGGWIHRFGLFGLTFPVWVPFMPLGALGSGVLGLALGFKPREIAGALLAAIAVSCVAWSVGTALFLA